MRLDPVQLGCIFLLWIPARERRVYVKVALHEITEIRNALIGVDLYRHTVIGVLDVESVAYLPSAQSGIH